MNPFRYAQAADPETAIATMLPQGGAYIAGGTNVLDLMKDDVERPSLLVDITKLPWHTAEPVAGGLRLGSLMTMAAAADTPEVKADFPVIAQSLLDAASPQLRNMATIGGNVVQRTRCAYFRDVSQPCNKRKPGEGCTALGGQNRMLGVIGTSLHCICTHPSDFAVALLTVDALVHTRGPRGARSFPFEALHVLPGERPDRETVLERGELIEALELRASPHARNSTYLKVRDRASYEFALVAVAAALDVGGGTIRAARVGLGGVAPKPWRAQNVEAMLVGQRPSTATFARAAKAASSGMHGYGHNDFKIGLTERSVLRALQSVGGAE